jgi:hypothetical protein
MRIANSPIEPVRDLALVSNFLEKFDSNINWSGPSSNCSPFKEAQTLKSNRHTLTNQAYPQRRILFEEAAGSWSSFDPIEGSE